jgi:hypothetical protein
MPRSLCGSQRIRLVKELKNAAGVRKPQMGLSHECSIRIGKRLFERQASSKSQYDGLVALLLRELWPWNTELHFFYMVAVATQHADQLP